MIRADNSSPKLPQTPEIASNKYGHAYPITGKADELPKPSVGLSHCRYYRCHLRAVSDSPPQLESQCTDKNLTDAIKHTGRTRGEPGLCVSPNVSLPSGEGARHRFRLIWRYAK